MLECAERQKMPKSSKLMSNPVFAALKAKKKWKDAVFW